ncbi:unnamed protein product [Rotaria sordida]|uniref:C2 domain-containing protein n=1 Tax=Rotaria sordida TaxID=392033 RepID=A0A818MZN7_9BILA|nr:unnamed protein product [Rotaria sordida]CAF0939436.1 unnamed protein product [Rotaria sordida]CAF3572551.1 unnamed protein product [Rotaria sordida]CAF3597920.1 unnamed protein product [Rotaria sordida]
MTCESEHSFVCLYSKRDYHWFWILLPIGLLIVCLIYILSRPNHTRLSSHTYQRITPTKNVISLHPQKQQNYAFNQHAKYSIPIQSSKVLFEQSCETNDNMNASINNSNEPSPNLDPYQWNELRTPVLANYPDIIDVVKARRINNELNPRTKNCPLLSNNILTLINKGFGESDPYPINNNLGRIWFFLEYNPYLRQLYLTIIKARNLRSIKDCQPTTFVRAEILPTLNTNFSTNIIKENSNPDYMTEIIFNINLSEFAHNVLKLTVHEIDRDVFHIPIGTIYYPLDHLLIAQRAKGHAVWRNLLPDYGDPSAIGLIQIRATVCYDVNDECLNIYVHSLRATGIVKQVYQVYVHASVAIHDFPVIPEEHIESSQIIKKPFTHDKCGPIVSLEQYNDTIYDQLFRFNIYKHEFNDMTVVLDVYRRSLGDEFFDDILLGRTILVSPEMLTKNLNNETLVSPIIEQESKTNPKNEEIQQKKKERKRSRKRKKKKR